MSEPTRRIVARQMISAIATVTALALVCATEQRPPSDQRTRSHAVDLAAAIVESPTTVGVADSDVMRTDSVDEINHHLDLLQSIGVQNVRVGISWNATQSSENGDFDWAASDYMIEEAHRRGMGVLGVLHETPTWAGSPPLSGMPDPDAFGSFAGAVAERYEGKVSALEVWNEPNGRLFLDPLDPAGYTAMLQAAYTAIKVHDDPGEPADDITVIAGVLGSGRTVRGVSMNPVDYLKGMYLAGAHGYFDAFSFHPYQPHIPFSAGENQQDSPILQLRAIRDLMRLHGDADLKVWASEYGLPTTPFNPLLPLQYNTLRKQARFIADFLSNWQLEEGTGPVFIYSTMDLNSGSFIDESNFGLFYSNGLPKPAAKVIVDFINGANLEIPGVNLFNEITAIVDGTLRFAGAMTKGAVDIVAGVIVGLVSAAASVASWVLGDTWVVNAPRDAVTTVVRLVANAITGTVGWVGDAVSQLLGIRRSAPATNRMAAVTSVSTVDDSPLDTDALTDSGEPAEAETIEHDAPETTVPETATVETEAVDIGPDSTDPESEDTVPLDSETLEPEITEVDPSDQPTFPTDDPTDIGSEDPAHESAQENETETDGHVETADAPEPPAATQASEEPVSVGAE